MRVLCTIQPLHIIACRFQISMAESSADLRKRCTGLFQVHREAMERGMRLGGAQALFADIAYNLKAKSALIVVF
jgi:hypothetical protein